MLQRKIDIELTRFLSDNPSLSHWADMKSIRFHPRDFYSHRTEGDSFYSGELSSLINPRKFNIKKPLRILFAHFSPYQYELEALGLPIYTSKVLNNNSIIDMTYDKGGASSSCFTVKDDRVFKKNKIEERYDLIIARSSCLANMMSRDYDRIAVQNSNFIVNIKTMSYKPNYQYAHYYFDEEEMCPPPGPHFLKLVENFLSKNQKKNLIVVSGTMWHVKNQLSMFKQLDPNIVKNFKFVIMGSTRHSNYVKEIVDVCDQKKLDYYLIGSVCQELANDIKCLSKISIIPMDMRVFGQPKGYPRTLGESIGAKCLTVCNKPVTVPSFYKNSCMVYDENNPDDLNEKLFTAIQKVNEKDFVKNYNWGEKDFFDVCEETLLKCLSLSGITVTAERNDLFDEKV